jgi:hypothetical protein
VLTVLLAALGFLLAELIAVAGLFWIQGALVKAVEDVREGRADLSWLDAFSRVRPQLGSIIVAGAIAGIAIALGLLLFVAPGLVLITWWFLIVPLIVLERMSAGASFGRSRELVRGYGWQVFGVVVPTLLLLLGFGLALGLVLEPVVDWANNIVANIITAMLGGPFLALVWTLLYYRLREAKSATPEAVSPFAPAS